MANETPNQLAEMFAIASELPAADRASYLERECAGKPELRRKIEDLLAHDQAPDDLLEHPAWEGMTVETSADEGALSKPNNPGRLLAAWRDHPILRTPAMADAGRPRIDTNAETPDHPQQNVTGLTIDKKYRIDRVLGKGAMGAVYLATHLGTTRIVALKVINPELAARDEFLVRFRREAVAAGSLRHPNIVNVTDFGIADLQGTQLPYLVMEYLDGQTLSDYHAQHGPMPLDQVVDVVDQIALALDKAHAAGVVHRDLKPDNIWVESNGRRGFNVKVLDFGIAKMVSGENDHGAESVDFMPPIVAPANDEPGRTMTLGGASDELAESSDLKTRPGAILGTPAYMSPEQCLGRPVDYRADIYSLAVITYELVAGRRPFRGKTVSELLTQHAQVPVPSPREVDEKISEPLAGVVMRGLEKDPEDRPPSAGALATLLRAIVEGEFSVIRKGKDTFQSYPSVFTPLWVAAFSPMLLIGIVTCILLPRISKPGFVPDGVVVVAFFLISLSAWLFCAQLFKAAAALMIQRASSLGIFCPSTSAVIGRVIKGLPDLLYTQTVSLLDIRPTSIWQDQLWPVAWALDGYKGKDAITRSRQLSRMIPDIVTALLPRFYVPGLFAALLIPAVACINPAIGFTHMQHSVMAGSFATWMTIFYLFFSSRLYVLYGTAFPFLYSLAALCLGESPIVAPPATSPGRERRYAAKQRIGVFIWWIVPLVFVCLILIGLVRKL
jgi:serine/threonine protein kinase